MRGLHDLRRLYRQVDALLGRALPERVRLWCKGVGIAAARKLSSATFGRYEGVPSILPGWAYDAVCQASIDEPELSPEALLPYVRRVHVPIGNSSLGAGYARVWKRIGFHSRHVFVLGDADGRISDTLFFAIRKFSEKGSSNVVIVWTGPSQAYFDDLAMVRQIDLRGVSRIHQTIVLATILGRALIEIRPATIHVASSDVGWAMFRTIGAALGESSHLYAELPPIENLRPGMSANAADRSIASDLPGSIHLVAHLRQTREYWAARHGIDPAMVSLVPDNDSAAISGFDAADRENPRGWLGDLTGYAEQ